MRLPAFALVLCLGLLQGRPGPAAAQSLVRIPAPNEVATWTVRAVPEKVRPGDRLALVFTAELQPGWKMYSMESEAGKPLAISFENHAWLVPDGLPVESNVESGYDPNFDAKVTFFNGESTGEAFFRVRRQADPGQAAVSGKINYMVCSDRVCLPPTDFAFRVPVKVER